MTLNDLAKIIGGVVIGEGDTQILGVCEPDNLIASCVCVLWSKDNARFDFSNKEAAYIAKTGILSDVLIENLNGIEVCDPKAVWPQVLSAFERVRIFKGVHPTAHVSACASLGEGVHIGPNCSVMDNSSVGDNTWLQGNVFIGEDVSIGRGCVIEAGAVVLDGTIIKDRVIIHGGAVIGADGFGFARDARGAQVKIPQIGHVVIEDDVEIGALSSIDKATVGQTLLGKGSKIDNHVQIGHNCRLGANCIIAAMCGLAGSVTLGDNVILAAQSGVKDHVSIGDNAVVAGRGGVTKDTPSGAIVSGFPARGHTEELKFAATLRRLVKKEQQKSEN